MSLVASTASCVIGEPDFTEPSRTRPQLVDPSPPTTELIALASGDSLVFEEVDFEVDLLSEDAGEELTAVLLLNYGQTNEEGAPFKQQVNVNRKIPPRSLADGPRRISLSWRPSLAGTSHDCNTVTMLVTHEQFGIGAFNECPADLADSDTKTWFVAFCRQLSDCSIDDCLDDRPPEGYTYCPADPAAALAGAEEVNQ